MVERLKPCSSSQLQNPSIGFPNGALRSLLSVLGHSNTLSNAMTTSFLRLIS